MVHGRLFRGSRRAATSASLARQARTRCPQRIIASTLFIAFVLAAQFVTLLPDAYAQRGLAATNAMRSGQAIRQQQRQQQMIRQQRQMQRQQQLRRQREQQAQRQRVIKRQQALQKQRKLVRQKQIQAKQQARLRQREQARKRQQAAQKSRQSTANVGLATAARRTAGSTSTANSASRTRADTKQSTRLAALRKPAASGGGNGSGRVPPGKPSAGGGPPDNPPRLTPIFNAAARNTLASKVKIVGNRLKNFPGLPKKSVGMSGTAANMRAEFKRSGTDPKTINKGDEQRLPYDAAGRAREIVLRKPREFVRVHVANNQKGGWIMRAKDIKGLTPEQIKDKYALPQTPLMVSKVTVPAGTRLRVGRAAGQKGWGKGGNTQYEIKDTHLPPSAFGKMTPLKGVFSKPANTSGASTIKTPPLNKDFSNASNKGVQTTPNRVTPTGAVSPVTARYGNTNFSKPASGPTNLGTAIKPGSNGVSASQGSLKNGPPSGALSKQFDSNAAGRSKAANAGNSSVSASGNQPELKPNGPTF